MKKRFDVVSDVCCDRFDVVKMLHFYLEVRRGAESTQAKVQHALYDARRRLAEFVAPPSDVPQVRPASPVL